MTLQSSGTNVTMSLKDVNVELGQSATATINLKDASEEFGETAPFGMDELFGLSNDAPEFTTPLSATADTVDPSKVVLAWAVGVPTGAPAISSFTLKRATDSNITQNVSTLSTNAAGSPVNDTGLAGGTQFFYRASATNAVGTTVSNDNATTTAARTAIAIKYLRQEEQGESNVFTGWISTAGSVASTKGELVLCAEGVVVPEDSRGSGISTVLLSENEAIADGTLSNGDTLFAGTTGTSVSAKKPNDDLVNQETFLVDTTQNNIFQINTSGVLSNVRSRTPSTPGQPSMTSRDADSITVNVTADTSVTRQLIPVQDGSDLTAILPSDSGSIDDTSITTSYTFSGLAASTTYALGFKGKNAFATTSVGTTLSQATTGAATSISSTPASPSIDVFNNPFASPTVVDSAVGSLITVSITNRSGNSTITETESLQGSLEFAWSTTGDPGESGTDNGGSGFAGGSVSNVNGDTIYIRPKFTEGGRDVNESGNGNINVTNNSVSHDKTVAITVGGR
jgi:hypothetical protein